MKTLIESQKNTRTMNEKKQFYFYYNNSKEKENRLSQFSQKQR